MTIPGIAQSPVVRWILFPVFLAAGAAIGTLHLVAVTRIQQVVRPDNRGRVFAVAETITAALLPAAYAVSGIAAELLRDLPAALYSGVEGGTAAVTVVILRNRALRSTLEDEENVRDEETTAGAR